MNTPSTYLGGTGHGDSDSRDTCAGRHRTRGRNLSCDPPTLVDVTETDIAVALTLVCAPEAGGTELVPVGCKSTPVGLGAVEAPAVVVPAVTEDPPIEAGVEVDVVDADAIVVAPAVVIPADTEDPPVP